MQVYHFIKVIHVSCIKMANIHFWQVSSVKVNQLETAQKQAWHGLQIPAASIKEECIGVSVLMCQSVSECW